MSLHPYMVLHFSIFIQCGT